MSLLDLGTARGARLDVLAVVEELAEQGRYRDAYQRLLDEPGIAAQPCSALWHAAYSDLLVALFDAACGEVGTIGDQIGACLEATVL